MKKHTLDLRDMPMFHEEMPIGAGAPELERPVIDGILASEIEVEMPAWVKKRLKKGATAAVITGILILVLGNIGATRVISAPRTITRSMSQSATATTPQNSLTSGHKQTIVTTPVTKSTSSTSGVGGGQTFTAPTNTPSSSPQPSPSASPSPSNSPDPTPSPSPTPSE